MTDTLLDVNALLALAWPNHQFHASARNWFDLHSRQGWSTCAITQLGFVRLSSNSKFTPLAKTPKEALALLDQLIALPGHRFLDTTPAPTDPGFRDLAARILGPNQVTDAFLLATARLHGTKLVTFDSRIRHLDSDGRVVTLS